MAARCVGLTAIRSSSKAYTVPRSLVFIRGINLRNYNDFEGRIESRFKSMELKLRSMESRLENSSLVLSRELEYFNQKLIHKLDLIDAKMCTAQQFQKARIESFEAESERNINMCVVLYTLFILASGWFITHEMETSRYEQRISKAYYTLTWYSFTIPKFLKEYHTGQIGNAKDVKNWMGSLLI